MQFPPVALRNDLVSYQRNGLQNVKKFYRACHAIVAELMESKIFSKKKKQVLKDPSEIKCLLTLVYTAADSTCIAVMSYFWRCNVNSTHNLLWPLKIKTIV